MTELVTSDKQTDSVQTLPRHHLKFQAIRRPLTVVLLIVCVIVLCLVVSPRLFWAYNIDRAGRAMNDAIRWPSPCRVDSLPGLQDEKASQIALAHLAAATKWDPTNAYGRRLAAHVYLAQGELAQAAEEMEQAYNLSPKDPLISWERALIYDTISSVISKAPRENIIPDLASVPINAPNTIIDTVYCRNDQAQTCYVDVDQYTLPATNFPNGPFITADVLFMHPPANVQLSRFIDPQRPAVQFLMGIDPGMRGSETDGVTFQVWLMDASMKRTQVFSQTLTKETARTGWHTGWIDLSAWSGQTIVLEFRTTGGPKGDTVNDWYAWGNVSLTTIEAAKLAMLTPEARVRQALEIAETNPVQLAAFGDIHFEKQQFDIAAAWYKRTLALGNQAPSLQFRALVSEVVTTQLLPEWMSVQEFTIHSADDGVRIDAGTLQWVKSLPAWGLQHGDQVAKHSGADHSIGRIPWAGTVVAFVQVREAGLYRVTMRAQNSVPPPIKLQIEHNLGAIASVNLEQGDGSWQEDTVDVFLNPGVHLIGVRFLNDSGDDGFNRDAVVSWIEIRRK